MNHALLHHRSKSDYENYRNLPFAVYITHWDGTIIEANQRAIELFSLPKGAIGQKNIIGYYESPEQRDWLLKKLDEKEDGEWLENQTVKFIISQKQISLKFFTKVIKENRKLLGSLCIVFKITGFETFGRLEDSMPIGLFEIAGGEKNTITYNNEKFKDVLSINSNEGPFSILEFFPQQEAKSKYITILKELKEHGIIKDKVVDLIRKDNRNIVGRFNVIADEFDSEGKVVKAKGILEDITYADILEELPIGLFNLKLINNDYQVVHCNEYFSAIFSYSNVSDCTGRYLADLINNELDYRNLAKLMEALPNGALRENASLNLIENYFLIINTKDGPKEVIIHIKKLKDRNDIQRFNGVLYNVTNDVHRILFRWREDIEQFLHTFRSMCAGFKLTLRGIISTHGTNLVENSRVKLDLAYKQLQTHISEYKRRCSEYVKVAQDRFGNSLEHERFVAQLEFYHERLSIIEKEGSSKMSMAAIRSVFINIRNVIEQFGLSDKLPREEKRVVINEIANVFRFSRLISLHYMVSEVLEMGDEIEELKVFMLTDEKLTRRYPVDILGPINEAIYRAQEYALSQHVDIVIKPAHKKLIVLCDQRDLHRVFLNVIENAIKYSWKKPDELFSTVKITITEDGLDTLISVENRGVGIPIEEIESGELFRLSNRGKYSSDRQRVGTGVGLWHTNKVVTEMGGSVKIMSRPIDISAPQDFNKPFLTEVLIKLPLLND